MQLIDILRHVSMHDCLPANITPDERFEASQFIDGSADGDSLNDWGRKTLAEENAAAAKNDLLDLVAVLADGVRLAMNFDDGDVLGCDHNRMTDALGQAETLLAARKDRANRR